MDQRTPNEWAKIIRDYMTSSNDVVVDDTSEPSSDEDFVETGGLYDWSFRPGNMTAWRAPMGRRKAGPWPEQNSSQTNTGAESASLPAPLQNSTAQQTFSSPVNYNNQVYNMNQQPPEQQQAPQQPVPQQPNASQFYTSPPPNTGIYANNNDFGVTNVNNQQYSNVNPNTIQNLNQPAQPRNINEISDSGNIMCTDCIDCRNCFNCSHCVSCDRCTSCDACKVCDSCLDCVGSTNLFNCHQCNNCNFVRDSDHCTNCNNCHHLVDCSNCSDLSYAIGYVKNQKVI